jgi:excinuclease UvrABC nuclease subunit
MFHLDTSRRELFNAMNLAAVPRQPGVYIIYDLGGPVYVGRSRVNIHRRLHSHLYGTGNRNIAMARRVGGASSLTFTFCCLPAAEQATVESILIAALGVGNFANLRREGLYEEDL